MDDPGIRRCDHVGCTACEKGWIANVTKALVANGWADLRLETARAGALSSRTTLVCGPHAAAVRRGDRIVIATARWQSSGAAPARSLDLPHESLQCSAGACARQLLRGPDGSYARAVVAAGWSVLRIDSCAIPGSSLVAPICATHASLLVAGRSPLAIAGWHEDPSLQHLAGMADG